MNLSPLLNNLVGGIFDSLAPRTPAPLPQAPPAPGPQPLDATTLSPEVQQLGSTLLTGLSGLLSGLGSNFGETPPPAGQVPPTGQTPPAGQAEGPGQDKEAKKAARKEKRKLRKAARKGRKKAGKGKGKGGGASAAGGASPAGSPGGSPGGSPPSSAPSRTSPSRIPSTSPISRGSSGGSSPFRSSSGGSSPFSTGNGSSSPISRGTQQGNMASPPGGKALPSGGFARGTPTSNSDDIHITQVVDPKYNPNSPLTSSADCGPTSLAMGLKALGIGSGSGQERTNAARFAMFNGFDSNKDGVDANGNFAANEHQGALGCTNTDDIKRGAAAAGARTYDVGSSGDIARAVGQGNPVVLAGQNSGSIYGNGNGIDYNGGHFILVSGYDPKTDTFTINDPLSHGGPLQISRAQLEAYQTGPGIALSN